MTLAKAASFPQVRWVRRGGRGGTVLVPVEMQSWVRGERREGGRG